MRKYSTEKIAGISIAIIIAIILLIVFIPTHEKGTITRFSWEYSIDVEVLRDVERSGRYLPGDATLLYTSTEQETETEKVRVGYDTDGRPKYSEVKTTKTVTVYHYTQKVWQYLTTYVETGFGRDGMKFPEVKLEPDQKLANGKQTYSIQIEFDDGIKTIDTSYDNWCEAEIGGRVGYWKFKFSDYSWGLKPV